MDNRRHSFAYRVSYQRSHPSFGGEPPVRPSKLGARLKSISPIVFCDVYHISTFWTGVHARPNLAVTYDERDLENDGDVLRWPTLLVEILSENTRDELSDNLGEYQGMSSVENTS